LRRRVWTDELSGILARFPGRRVLLAGDFMLDRYVVGEVGRNNPEAPGAAVLRARQHEERVGGAGFVALSITALGGQVACFGVIGNDPAGGELRDRLQQAGAEVDGLLCVAGRPTTVKSRFLRRVGERCEHLLRVDEEDDSDLTHDQSEWLLARFRQRLAWAEVVVLQDYAKGVLAVPTCAALVAAALAADKPVLVDPARCGGWEKFAGATLLKPNRAELEAGAGRSLADSELEAVCRELLERLRLEAMLVTLGCRGSRLVLRTGGAREYPAVPVEQVDPVGAGDAALAALSLVVAAGGSLEQAAALANVAAGLEVGRAGCIPVETHELKSQLERGTA
jgi:D-beta-D-heptose 7-phosphate kinase/D-beta-D-heptose 1-phosphate adenosyltransferase